MRILLLGLVLAVLAGCGAPCKAPRFGIGDKVLVKEERLGVVIGTGYSAPNASWYYEIQTRGGPIEVYDKEITSYQTMDWNELETCPRVRIENIPPIPTLAPPQKKDKTT